jgi:hypothetical protein
MNRSFAVLTLLFISIPIAVAKDGTFVTRVIHETDPAVSILLQPRQFITITNFVQDAPLVIQDENGNFISHVATVTVYQGAMGLSGINVLTASQAGSTHVAHEDCYIAGPAIVNIASLSSATLFITYLKGSN